MAGLRNLTTGLIHASGRTAIVPTLRWVGRNPIRALQFLSQTALILQPDVVILRRCGTGRRTATI